MPFPQHRQGRDQPGPPPLSASASDIPTGSRRTAGRNVRPPGRAR
ncbi:hypothetical protein [Kitasatospora albolonga]